VATRERDLQRPSGLQLPSDLGQIRCAAPVRRGLARRRLARNSVVPLEANRVGQLHAWRHRSGPPAPVRSHQHCRLGQSRRGHDLDATCERCLGGAVRRHDHSPHPPPGQGGDHGQQAGHRAQVAAQRKLAQHGPAARRLHLLRADHDPERDRQIERGATLAEIGRRQVHGDAPRRVLIAAVANGSSDALTSLLQRGVRQPDDREARQARSYVHLHADDATIETVESGGEQRRKHAGDATSTGSPPAYFGLHPAVHPSRRAEPGPRGT